MTATRIALLGTAIAGLCCCLPGPGTAERWSPRNDLPFQLLIPGHYRMDVLPPRTEGQWFALVVSSTNTSLLPVAVRLREANNPNVTGDLSVPGAITEIDGADSVLFLVRGGRWNRRDSVPTWFRGNARLSPGQSLVIRGPAGKRWRVAASDAQYSHPFVGGTFGIAVHDSTTGHSDDLGGWPQDDSPQFMWMGDLDRDGQLDLFLHDATHESGAQSWTLYLSSQAKGKSIFGKAAEFWTPGC